MNKMLDVSSGSLFQYVTEVNKFPVLTDEEEIDYAKKKDKGDVNAAKMLVSSYLRLVVKIASSYKDYGIPLMDLISEGNIGLMRAVKTFDYKKGFKLATYSLWWIKAYIQEYILKSWSIVKLGTTVAQKKLFFNLKKVKNKILDYSSNKYLTDNDVKKISQIFGVSEREVIDMDTRLSKKDLSLNTKINSDDSDENSELIDLVPSTFPEPDVVAIEEQEKERKQKLLNSALAILNDREREIIESRFFKEVPLTFAELSKKYGISGERVRQIEAKSLEKMKSYLKNEKF